MTQTAVAPAKAQKAVVPYLRQFDDHEKSLIAAMLNQVAPKASKEEKILFLYTAQKKGLDPFDKQIYLVPRWDNASGSMRHSVQVSIDGLRLMAQRSGKYAGQVGPLWCGKDGKWVDVWLGDEPPSAAKVGILRHDFKEPLWSVALFDSYKQTKKDGSLNTFWQKFGAHMLAKCSEALSIRRGFPEETSGFYIPEEMGNAEIVYVEELAQDNSAPMAVSEIVEDTSVSSPQAQQTRQAQQPTQTPRPTQQAATGQSKPVLDMIATAKRRVESMGLLWDDVKRDALGNNIPDTSLTVELVAKINGYCTTIQRNQQKSS